MLPSRKSQRTVRSHHLGQQGEVCGSAVRQEGTVVVSRPRAAVHPQHGAHSRGGGSSGSSGAAGRTHAALGTSFPGRGRPIAPVRLVGGTKELGVAQLRERHVRGISLEDAGVEKRKRKIRIPRIKKGGTEG